MSGKVETTVNEQNGNCRYVGDLSNISMESVLSFAPPNKYESIPSIRLFIAKYHAYPCILHSWVGGPNRLLHSWDDDPNRLLHSWVDDPNTLLHASTITDYIRDELKHDLNTDYTSESYNYRTEQMSIDSRFCDLGNGVMIDIDGIHLNSKLQNPNKLKADYSDDSFLIASRINIYYLPDNRPYVQDLVNRFSKMTLFFQPPPPPPKSFTLKMVCRDQDGYYLSSINIKKPLIIDLALNYGKNFVSIHEKIITNLNKKEEKGIVLLHGIPGSGKTHYIRYLIHEIEDKTLIYIPPDMAKEISAPNFLPFLMQYPNSILIIEDAENIIQDRNESSIPSQAVANLLNLSDGLLGDAMHQQIIATFNCDLTTIDPALLRQGRLIANYEFNKLDLETSKTLSDKLGFGIQNINEPMTLAQIYNQDENVQEKKQQTILNEQK